MTLQFCLQWGASPYYKEGQYLLEVQWNSNILPQAGEHISIMDFIDNSQITQVFTIEGKPTNIFEWIDSVNGWFVENWSWKRKDGQVYRYYVISDMGYLT